MRIIFLLLLLLAFPGLIYPQSDSRVNIRHQIDSLQKRLPGSGNKDQTDLLNNLAASYAPINFDTSIMYSAQAMRLATVYGYPLGVGMARLQTGNAYYYKMDFKNALISYLAALKVLEENEVWKEAGDVYMQLGHIHYFIWSSEKAFHNYRKAEECYRKAGKEEQLIRVYDAMSTAMFFLKYPFVDSTLHYGFNMLEKARIFNDRYKEVYALMNIGMFYSNENKSPQKKQKTLAYCDTALILASENNFQGLKTITYIVLGNYYDNNTPFFNLTGNYTRSRHFYELAYKSDLNDGSSYLQATILNNLACIDLKEKKYDLAQNHLKICETKLNQFFTTEWENTTGKGYIDNPLGKIMDYFMAQRERVNMYYSFYELAAATRKPEQAVDYLHLYYKYRDSFFYSTQGQQLELIMTEAEAEKTDQKIRMLSQNNELNQLRLSRTKWIFAGAGAVVLIISLFLMLYFQRKKLKAEQKSIQMEQRLLRAQMNPHFIFNSLASIQNFIINEKTDEATIYLSRFSQLVRNVLDNSVEEYVSLENEIDAIQNYLELQKVRYVGKFEYKMTVDERIDQENTLIPPMLAQPFIENSIEHGIKHRKTIGNIDIRFMLDDGLIRFEVEDDGVGRQKAHEIEHRFKHGHKSMSTSITRDRLYTINKKLRKKILMEIIDLKDTLGDACGTKVTFGIPVVMK